MPPKAPAAVISSSHAVTATGINISIARPALCPDGSLLVMVVLSQSAGAGTWQSTPSGWVEAYRDWHPSSNASGIQIFTKIAASEPSSWAVTGNTSHIRLSAVLVFSDATGFNVAGGLARVNGTATATASSITPTQPGVLIGVFSTESNQTVSSGPAGMTQQLASSGSGPNRGFAVYKAEGTPGGTPTGTKTLTWSAAGAGGIRAMLFQIY